jgi:hypothetical protein
MPSDVNVTATEWDADKRFVSLQRALEITLQPASEAGSIATGNWRRCTSSFAGR